MVAAVFIVFVAAIFIATQKLKITVSDKEVIFYNNSELYKMAFLKLFGQIC